MSGDRDALAALITETIGDNHDGSAVSAPDRIVLIVQSDGDGAVTISTSALADAILAGGWRYVPDSPLRGILNTIGRQRACEHQWSDTTTPEWGRPFKTCSLCGATESVPKSMDLDLDAVPPDDERARDEAAYDEAWQARDWDEVRRIQDKWGPTG